VKYINSLQQQQPPYC